MAVDCNSDIDPKVDPTLHLFFQSYGQFVAGSIDEKERKDIVRFSCPGAGACGGMYTANTMAAAIEAMGMSLPYRWVVPRRSVKFAPHKKSVSWTLCLSAPSELGGKN
jgi:dihydroxyacid dehydratase/phosphogluconate dehydratase